MPTLPMSDKNGNIIAPHIVILGAGASIALTKEDKELYYNELPSMNNLVEKVGLEGLLDTYNIDYKDKNFEILFEELSLNPELTALTKQIEDEIYKYFYTMKLPDKLTMYDYLIMSLTSNDVIATFNWDPFLIQALARCSRYTHELPRLIHLHGNVGIGVCYEDSVVGHKDAKCGTCHKNFEPTTLLYPIGKKDYASNPLIKDEWDTLKRYMEFAYYITIFGYSAPISDLEAKKLLLDVWVENRTMELAQIEIIDIVSSDELSERWADFIFNFHYGTNKDIFDSYLFRFPRRSCSALFQALMMLQPRAENPFPKFETLEELWMWIKSLIEEEKNEEAFLFQVLENNNDTNIEAVNEYEKHKNSNLPK